jgi:DNA topoisomerase IA
VPRIVSLIYEKTKDQFEVVRKIVNSPRISRVVCATDAGREGELIFRYIYEAAQCEKPWCGGRAELLDPSLTFPPYGPPARSPFAAP